MASFLVEAYSAKAEGLQTIAARADAAADELRRAGASVRYVRWIFMPEDEVCFHVFEAASKEDVERAAKRGELAHERIVEALQQGGER